MAERNGQALTKYSGLPDPFVMNAVSEMVRNSFLARSQFLDKYIDGRRDIDAECNYPVGEFLPIDVYRALYAREAVAERVVQVWPKESWQVSPNVYEDDDPEVTTPFEEAFENLGKSLMADSYYRAEGGSPGGNLIWSYLCRADILSGIGTFGIILLGIDDGKLLEESLDGVTPDGNPYRGDTAPVVTGNPYSQGPDTEPPEVTNPSQAGPNVPGPNSAADKQLEPEDMLDKSIYGPMTQEQKLSSTMGTDAQYFGYQFTPTSYHGGNPQNPMMQGGYSDGDSPPTDEQAPGSPQSPKRKLLYLRVFDESLVQVVQYEADIRNPRFGQPLMYLVTLNDPNQPHTGVGLPLATVRVHWSRVIHVCDNRRNSEIFGIPRMQPVLNRLLDLRKLYGGSAEGYWKGALPIISLETNPQLGGDVIVDNSQLQTMMANIMNSLQRYMTLTGLSAKTIAPQVADPTAQIDKQIEAICIELSIPVRVFKGSERGELASSQDDSQWNDRLRHRQQIYLTPHIVVPFIDRLIAIGVLPKPQRGYRIEWPDLDSQTDVQKAQILLQKTQAYAAYQSGNVAALIQPIDYLTHVDDLDDDLAQTIVDTAEQKQDEEQQQAQDLATQHGFVPEPPDGFTNQPKPPKPQQPIKLKEGERLVQPLSNPQSQQPQQPPSPRQAQDDEDTTENTMLAPTVIGNSRFASGRSVTGKVLVFHGGAGSGDFGHAGRPGEVGGSEPGGGGGGHGEVGHGEHAPAGSQLASHANEVHHLQEFLHGVSHVFSHGAKEGVEAGIKGVAGHEAAAHGHEAAAHGHEAVGGEHVGLFGKASMLLGAAGGIIGSKIGESYEKALGLDKAYNQLYEKMKAEHGEEEARFLHTAASVSSIAVKTGMAFLLGHVGMGGMLGKMAATAGATAMATVGKARSSGTKAFGQSTALGIGSGALGAFGEHVAEAATEGLAGLTAFSVPGVAFLSLYASHLLGKALDKSGMSSTKTAAYLGQKQKSLRESRVGRATHALLHGVHEHLEHITGARFIKEGKLIGEHTAKAWEGGKKLGFAVGKAVGRRLRLATNALGEPLYDVLGQPLFVNAGEDTMNNDPRLSLDNPAVQEVIGVMRTVLKSLLSTAEGKQLWQELCTPAGAKVVMSLMGHGETNAKAAVPAG